MKWKTKRTHK